MFKDLAVECVVLSGLFFFVFWFIPYARFSFSSGVAVLLFLCVLGFLGLAVFQLRRLLNCGKKEHGEAFAVILIATVIVAFVIAWLLSIPIPMNPRV